MGKRIFAPELDHPSIQANVPLRDLLRRIIEFAQRQPDLPGDVTNILADTSAGALPLTTKGDLLTRDDQGNIRLAGPTIDGQVLKGLGSEPGGLVWGDVLLDVLKAGSLAGSGLKVNFTQSGGATVAVVNDAGNGWITIDIGAATLLDVLKAGALIGSRQKINFTEDGNVVLTIADNPGAGRVDIGVQALPGGAVAPFTKLWGWDWTLSPYLSDLAIFKSSGTDPLLKCAEVWKPGLIDSVGVHTAGAGYTVDDWLTIVQAGASDGSVRAATVDGGGGVTSAVMVNGGENYSVAAGLATTGGTGTGCKISIGGTAYDLNTDNYLPRLRFFNPYNSAAVLRLMLLSAVSVTPAANHLLFLDLDFQLINNIAAGSGIVIAQVGSETDVFYLIEVYRATSSCALLKRTGGAYQTQFSSAGYSSHYQWVNVKIIYNPNAGAIGGISPGGVLVYNAGQPLFKKPMTLTNATVLSGPVRVGWLIPGAAGARANEIRLGRIEAYSVPGEFIQLLP